MHEARLGMEFDGGDQFPNSSTPQLQVAGAFTSGGNTGGRLRDHEIDTEFDDDAILSLSKHLLKFGLQSEYLRERMVLPHQLQRNHGSSAAALLPSSIPSLTSPPARPKPSPASSSTSAPSMVGTVARPPQYSNAAGNPNINMTQYRLALFLQDDWKVLPNLHFAWGLRYYTQNKPMVHNNFNPRFGPLLVAG